MKIEKEMFLFILKEYVWFFFFFFSIFNIQHTFGHLNHNSSSRPTRREKTCSGTLQRALFHSFFGVTSSPRYPASSSFHLSFPLFSPHEAYLCFSPGPH
jgi:hypothetical protein